MNIKRITLLILSILVLIVSLFWWRNPERQGYEAVIAVLTAAAVLIQFFAERQQKDSPVETLDQRNRRRMLNHVENAWVKGFLEKSLYPATLLELGIKEEPGAVRVSYPWSIKKEATDEILPPGKSMLKIFEEVGMDRSLLILGAPGSGKTTMLLELTRQLIEHARNDETEPIPVVFNLASWKAKQTLPDWLAEQLNTEYRVGKKTASTWVNENRMFLLLDGLDEVKEGSRAACVDAINQFRKEHGLTSLVICSRIEEYSMLNTTLALEGAIALQPLTSKQVRTYFDKFGLSLAGLKQLLKKDKILQELAETPLMLSVMALAYKDKKADELTLSGNLEKQRKQLFDTYIARRFEPSSRTANTPFSKGQTLHYLSWLARTMSHNYLVMYQIEMMQPYWLEQVSQRRLYRLLVGLLGGLLVGLSFGLFMGLLMGPFMGLFIGLFMGLSFGLFLRLEARIGMEERLNWSWKAFGGGLIRGGLIGGLIGWLLGLLGGLLGELLGELSFGLTNGLTSGLTGGLSLGLIGGLSLGLIGGLIDGLVYVQIEETTRPGQRLEQTRFTALVTSLSFWLVGGLIGGLIGGLTGSLFGGLIFGQMLGLTLGLFFGMIYGILSLIQHNTLRFILTKHGLLPKDLVSFLDYSVDLIFLRRIGGSYTFIHRLLMEHLAENEATSLKEEEFTAQEWLEKGLALRTNQNFNEAIRCFSEAIRLRPKDAIAYLNRGFAHRNNNDLQGALADYDQVIRLQPKDATAYLNRGLARRDNNDLQGALADFDQVIRLRPDDADAYYFRGLIRDDNNDLQGALADYDQVIRLRPDDADAYYYRGLAHRDNNDLQGALADFDQAIRLQPKDAEAYNNRAVTHQLSENLEAATRDFEEAVRLQSDYAIARVSLTGILRKLGRNAEAKEQEKLARVLITGETEYNQACFEAICGNVEKALELLMIGLEKKQVTKAWARRDPDFENIREDARFKEIVGL